MRVPVGCHLIRHLWIKINSHKEGKVILDLGCGSSLNLHSLTSRMFEPWLCRALYELGVHPIGIDLAGLRDETFESYGGIDLSRQPLDLIADNSVDLANAHELFIFDGISYSSAGRVLLPQLERILRPGGVFIYNDPNY